MPVQLNGPRIAPPPANPMPDGIDAAVQQIKYNRGDDLIASADMSARQPNEPAFGPSGTFGVIENSPDVNENYVVTINSSFMKKTIRAHMQDDFSIETQSTWQRPALSGALSELQQGVQVGAQAATGRQFGNAFMTRRIWKGTSPCVFTMRLKFDAVNDPVHEVVIPCEALQQMALPGSDAKKKTKSNNGLMSVWNSFSLFPPGPNPTLIDDLSLLGTAGSETKSRWNALVAGRADEITISIGRFLSFSSVIISKARATFKRKFAVSGHPVSAEMEIQFESFEMYTKESLHQDVYSKGLDINMYDKNGA